jgi:Tfp pilus assembly protein PilX
MRNNKGIILTLTIISVLVLLIIATISINLATNQARITENQLGRVKAYYTAEGIIVQALEELRKGTLRPPGSGSGYTRTNYALLNDQQADLCVIAAGASFDCNNDGINESCSQLPGNPSCVKIYVKH